MFFDELIQSAKPCALLPKCSINCKVGGDYERITFVKQALTSTCFENDKQLMYSVRSALYSLKTIQDVIVACEYPSGSKCYTYCGSICEQTVHRTSVILVKNVF